MRPRSGPKNHCFAFTMHRWCALAKPFCMWKISCCFRANILRFLARMARVSPPSFNLLTREVLPLHREEPPVVFKGNNRPTLADIKSFFGVVSLNDA